jgi:polysaccharide export outer membrane protein
LGYCVLFAPVTRTVGSVLVWLTLAISATSLAQTNPSSASGEPEPSQGAADAKTPLVQLGPGDSVSISVYGQPDMNATVAVNDDGTIPVALAGPVMVKGLSPAAGAREVEKALRDGMFLNHPQVTLTLIAQRSQRVSVLGEVGAPGRYPIESNTTILDLLASAGGAKESASSVVFLMRTESDGTVSRSPINLASLNAALTSGVPTQSLKGGDSILVPKADHYYIYGEIAQPNVYKLEPGLTVLEAIVRAGGVTPRGSDSRIELQRKTPDGKKVTRKAKPDDALQPDDILRVKERIF